MYDSHHFTRYFLWVKSVSLSQNENLNAGIIGSLALPGPLYATFSQTAIGIDENEYEGVSFDQEVRSFNIGAHMGVGDLLNSISVGSVSLNLQNFMDVFAELGIRQYAFETSSDFDESFRWLENHEKLN